MPSGGMRIRARGGDAWEYTNYSLTAMSHAILNELEYELEGRDY